MRVVAIVQARMGSTRLPRKVLKDLGGATVLERVLNRVRRVALADGVLVATTSQPADNAIVSECRRLAVDVFRGSETDVLDRYYNAAQQARADAVLRVTADCPFVDPVLLDELLRSFLAHRPDYASNCLVRTYPCGLDAEIITHAALSRAWREAILSHQRAHVTPYIYENPSKFQLLSVTAEEDWSKFRWTVDTAEDLEFARAVYLHFRNKDDFGWRDVLSLLSSFPVLAQINQHVRQKALQEG